MSSTPILDRLTADDDDVDLDAVRETARSYAEQGSYTDREEMEGAIANRIASQLMGWSKYQHLDSGTKQKLEAEIYERAAAIADDIEAETDPF